MPRFAVASSSLPPVAAAAAALGFGATPPCVLQAQTLAAAAPPPPWRRRLCMCSSSSSSTAAAVEEARRGRKQLGMTPQLYGYLLANVREHPVCPSPSLTLLFRFEPIWGNFAKFWLPPGCFLDPSRAPPRDSGHERKPDAGTLAYINLECYALEFRWRV